MDGLLEFVFDEVSSSNLQQGIIALIGTLENIIDVSDSENENIKPENVFLNDGYWNEFLNRRKGSSIFINISTIKIWEACVKNASIQVISYDGRIDLIILISSHDCLAAGVNLSMQFFMWAENIAVLFETGQFYGGLEPASDERTQLYNYRGPGKIFTL